MVNLPSSYEPNDVIEELVNSGYNRTAAAATLGYLGPQSVKDFFIGGKYKEVKCEDGSPALVFKNPGDAFKEYAKQWDINFQILLKQVESLNSNAGASFKSKIVPLYEGLTSLNHTIKTMYENSYRTFTLRPCDKESLLEKHRMDRIINAAALYLVNAKLLIDKTDAKNFEKTRDQIIEIINKVIDSLLAKQ